MYEEAFFWRNCRTFSSQFHFLLTSVIDRWRTPVMRFWRRHWTSHTVRTATPPWSTTSCWNRSPPPRLTSPNLTPPLPVTTRYSWRRAEPSPGPRGRGWVWGSAWWRRCDPWSTEATWCSAWRPRVWTINLQEDKEQKQAVHLSLLCLHPKGLLWGQTGVNPTAESLCPRSRGGAGNLGT